MIDFFSRWISSFLQFTMDSNASTQPVTLSTQTQYLIPSQKFMIPTTWRRYQLSQLINKVLELPKPVPFDFLVKGELLRSTLASWCAENGVGEVRSPYIPLLPLHDRSRKKLLTSSMSSRLCLHKKCRISPTKTGYRPSHVN